MQSPTALALLPTVWIKILDYKILQIQYIAEKLVFFETPKMIRLLTLYSALSIMSKVSPQNAFTPNSQIVFKFVRSKVIIVLFCFFFTEKFMKRALKCQPLQLHTTTLQFCPVMFSSAVSSEVTGCPNLCYNSLLIFRFHLTVEIRINAPPGTARNILQWCLCAPAMKHYSGIPLEIVEPETQGAWVAVGDVLTKGAWWEYYTFCIFNLIVLSICRFHDHDPKRCLKFG